MKFRFNEAKDSWLSSNRNVTFEDAIRAVADGGILADYEHPNRQRYPGQRIMVVRINGYPHCVPNTVEGETFFLQTVYPSRTFRHLTEGEAHD